MNKYILKFSILVALTISSGSLLVASPNQARLFVPESDLIFSHKFHALEAEVECEECHIAIETSADSQDKNLPTMETCGDCHDVDDDENCGMCHRDPEEPDELFNPIRPIQFNHQLHLANNANCTLCHGSVATTEKLTEQNMPKMALCMSCHDNSQATADCQLCHENRLTMADLHPSDWRHQHGDLALFNPSYCSSCHKQETFCVDCHSGDNLLGQTHALNYKYSHGLDARSKEMNCVSCHDSQTFCNDCHLRENRMPLEHSTAGWRTQHGQAAVSDVENCAVCHDGPDQAQVCGRAGCHSDFDAVVGTNPPIHNSQSGQLNSEGPWHNDDSYFCFQCHSNSRQSGNGFCGYCHD